MNSSILIGLFAVLLLGGAVYPSFSQSSSIADHVVINEIDINPPGDDSRSVSEWVELYNPTEDEINLGGWTISSTTVLKKTLTIPQGTLLEPGRFLAYSHVKVWFTDVSERVELRDANGILIDATPKISDLKSDFTSWQRIYDGLDTDSSSDWKFETSNAGSSNGKLTQEEVVEKAQVTVSVDKTNYVFGEIAIISGEVSERVFQEIPFFQAAKIKINIWGPSGYNQNIELFPDFFLKYKTELNLQEVLGVKEGVYFVSVQYDDSVTSANFSVGDEVIITEEIQQSLLSITTDKEFYISGETAKIIATTSEIVPFKGLKFIVLDPNGKQVFDGTLYPNPDGEFSTSIFLTTVGSVFGSYQIQGDYSTQSATNSFEISEDVKEEKLISLRTDKDVYGIGDTVIITGRLNTLWIDSLDIEILQTGIVALDMGTERINKVLDAVRLEGDSTFRYDYQIPRNDDSYGEYRVTVTKEIGTERIFFKVVANPDDFVDVPTKPFTINTDKTIYEAGDTIVFSGRVSQIAFSSQYYTSTIDIVVKSTDGKRIFTTASKPSSNEPGLILYSLTAIPDIVGNYEVKDTLYRAIYGEGSFIVSASYGDGTFTDSTSFSIIDPLKIDGFADVRLDKEVYGFGEDVHLTGLFPKQSQGVGITITLLKPDGDTDKFGTLVDDGRFTWVWTTPVSEKPTHIKSGDDRSTFATNLGIYRVTVGSDSGSIDIFFKVSENPAQDSLDIGALSVTTDKPVYNAGEKLKVSGMAIKRSQGDEGLVVPERAHIVISKGEFPFEKIYEAFVYLGPGGDFKTLFEMPVTIFRDGIFKVTATYLNEKAENVFQVSSSFLTKDSDVLSLLIVLDKAEYHPGDVVQINARPSKSIFPEFIKIGIPSEEQTKLNCGSFVCGTGVPTLQVRPLPDGTFHYEHTIPDDSSSIGKFVVTFDTEFGTFTKPFTVVEKPPEAEEPKPLADRVIEKFNRIPESFIPITVKEKLVDDNELHPRVIQGSLFAPKRGEEANVNLKVTTEDGTCIIGPAPDCAVSESTRIPGSIYKTIQIDGKDYNVRYSGPNVTLEKFTILPVLSDDVLPDSTWNVDILKDDQSSRFYYKVTYITTE